MSRVVEQCKLRITALYIGIFHNIYDGIAEELKQQVLIAIIKELATILQVDFTISLANKTPATVEMVCVAIGHVVVAIATLGWWGEGYFISSPTVTGNHHQPLLWTRWWILTTSCNISVTITDDEESWEDMEEEIEIGANGDEQNGAMSIVC